MRARDTGRRGTTTLLVALTLTAAAGCAARPPAAAPGSAPPTMSGAVLACSTSSRDVSGSLDLLDRAVTRGSALTATRQLAQSAAALQSRADAAGDDLVAGRLQDAADAVRAFLAVAGQPGASGYEDVLTAARGALSAYRSECPVQNAGFEGDVSGWQPIGGRTGTTVTAAAHDGSAGLQLRNTSPAVATVGITDLPRAVPRTHRGATYRVGAWVRSDTPHAPPLTLTVTEVVGGKAVRSVVSKVAPTPTWTFLGTLFRPSAGGRSGLEITLESAGTAPGSSVEVDDLAVARG